MLNNFLFFFEETEKSNNWGTWVTVSYTHLTLPTKRIV